MLETSRRKSEHFEECDKKIEEFFHLKDTQAKKERQKTFSPSPQYKQHKKSLQNPLKGRGI